jgi:hypothetical protein
MVYLEVISELHTELPKHSSLSDHWHVRSRHTRRLSILLVGRVHELNHKIVVARAQDSVLSQDLKSQVRRPNLDNELEIGSPVLLLQLPKLAILQFHVVSRQLIFDQDNTFAACIHGPVWQLIRRARRHHNLCVSGALMVGLCQGRCIKSRDAIFDTDHLAFPDEPTVNVSTSVPSTAPERLTQLRSPPIGGCHEGPPGQASPYASLRRKLCERRCHSCCGNAWW